MEISILRCSSEATARNLFLPEKLESFRTVVVCIYICRYNSVRFSRLESIFHTSFRRRKILYSYGRADDAVCCGKQGLQNPEAAFKIINYLIANEQTWVEEGVTSTEMGTADFYPLYNAYDNADEIETSYEVLTQYLAGEVGIDDVDFQHINC